MALSASLKLPFNAERIKYASDGTDYPDVTVSGSGFGLPPNIVLYRDWSRDSTGAMSLINNMVGSNFQLDQGIVPNVATAFGRNGVCNREGGTNAATNNRRTTFFTMLPAFKNFRIGNDMAVPAGRTFAGSATTATLPSDSAIKWVWLFDGAPDPANKADVVMPSWTSVNFGFLGNSCPYNVGGTSTFDFNDWNYFQGSQVAGVSPFVNNGVETFTVTNSIIGTQTNTKTDVPSFGAGADTAQYDRIYITAWDIGMNVDLCLHLMSYIYLATSNDDNCNQRVELMNNATYASATKVRLIPYKSWTDTQIVFSKMDHYTTQGFTHYRITAGANSIIGAL